MNLKKYTKAELISKIEGLKSNKNENNPTNFTNLMNLLLFFKSFILKFTLIAVIIKIFKKYSIFRRIWTIISTILFSIFGISLVDIYEIETMSNFFKKILDIFSNFHRSLLELFGKPMEVSNEMIGDLPTQIL